MAKRDWSLAVVAVVVATAALGTWAVSQSIQPVLVAPPARPATLLSSCGYEEAHRKAAEARNTREKQPTTASKEAKAKADSAVEAAQDQEREAKECEERAHTAADLEAQWASAVSAQNSANAALSFYRWASWELFIVALALGAAGWSAYETRKANRIARESAEAQLRPYPIVPGKGSVRYNIGANSEVALGFKIRFINAGATPAFSPSVTFRLFVFEFGPRQFTDRACILTETFEGLGDWAPNGGDFELERQLHTFANTIGDGVRAAGAGREVIEFTGHGYVHLEITVRVSDYAGRQMPEYAVYVESEGFIQYRGKNTSGNVVLSYPSLIRLGAPGYPPKT